MEHEPLYQSELADGEASLKQASFAEGAANGVPAGEPPVDLPRAPTLFWSVHPDFEDIAEAELADVHDVLERLGPPPFPKTGFPFIGFLATVYDHVVAHACRRNEGGG